MFLPKALHSEALLTHIKSSIILGQKLDEISSMGYRVEYYLDNHQSNIVTGTPNGFQVASLSVNYDKELAKETLWRTEARGFYSKDELSPQSSNYSNRWDGLIVTSLGLSF